MPKYWQYSDKLVERHQDSCQECAIEKPEDSVPSIPSASDEDLCETCHSIDFERAFAPIGGVSTWFVRGSQRISSAIVQHKNLDVLTCPLCRFFASQIPEDVRGGGALAKLSFELKRRRITDAFSMKIKKSGASGRLLELWKRAPELGDTVLVVTLNLKYLRLDNRFSWLPRAVLNCGSGLVHGRFVSPNTFNPTLVLGWILHCDSQESHRSCRRRPSGSVPGFRVIHAEKRILQPLPDNKANYVAVSWVWAGYKPQPAIDGVIPELPPVLEDSIAVAKMLGYEFVWIDAYCIDQNNAATKREQIQNMDLIYSRAHLTIIAAAGAGPSVGLAGVSSPRASPPSYVRVGDRILMTRSETPKRAVRSSIWSSRGWTYQEGLLSTRRLIFTENQIFFQCNNMCCAESMHWPDLFTELWHHVRSLPVVRGRQDIQHPGQQVVDDWRLSELNAFDREDDLWSIIRVYLTKSLTNENDIVNAITGILNATSKWRHVWGVPIPDSAPDISTGFAQSLVWQRRVRSDSSASSGFGRRRNYPSWSWVGWKTWGSWTWYPSSQLPPLIQQSLSYMFGQNWSCVASFHLVADSQSVTLNEWITEGGGRSERRTLSPYLGITAPIIPFEAREVEATFGKNSLDWSWRYPYPDHLWFEPVFAVPLLVFSKTTYNQPVPVGNKTYMAPDRLDEQLFALLIARCKNLPSDVPRGTQAVYERIGAGQLEVESGLNINSIRRSRVLLA